MSWPLSQDYNEAIQSPTRNFADAELRLGKPAVSPLGIPMPCSGNFADVYQILCPDGSRWAVKCFTREVPGLRERYQEISRHLRQAKLPFTVDFTYLEQGIRVAGKWWPVLKMQWVQGLTLNQFVVQYLDKPAMLEALAQVWGRLPKYLRSAEVGHCDLQHGNILLVPGPNANSLALKLIDYDGMWVPALARTKSGEVGHSSYQHPLRIREGTYSLEVDRFPLLVIATALRVLSLKGRTLWEKYDDGDNLLFKESDLRAPAESPLFRELLTIPDQQNRTLVGALLRACNGKVEEAPLLEELIPESKPAGSPTLPTTGKGVPVREAGSATRSSWDFNQTASGGATRRPPSRQAVPIWVWLIGSVAALAAAVVIILSMRSGENPKSMDTSPVAVKNPGDGDKSKNTETDSKKDKNGTVERPAPLPRIVAFPKLVLPARGSAELEVKVERQGYDGPIKLQVENLPRGVTCQPTAVIPAGESSLRLDFRTDGTAAEGTPTVEVIALADARTADRQKLSLVVPRITTVERPAPLPNNFKNSLGMEFVLVPKGKSWLGGGGGKPGDREVEIPQDFYLGKYAVTQEEWQNVMGTNPSNFKALRGVSIADQKRFPVEQVSWDDAQLFLTKLNEQDKQAGWVYRLPKDVEWEYACRGGPMTEKADSAFDYYFDKPTNQLLPAQANFFHGMGLKRTCKVGSYPPNPLGLHDMHGNVWEWCDDSHPNRESYRMIRGGSWTATAEGCVAASRPDRTPQSREHDAGLRVAQVPVGKEKK